MSKKPHINTRVSLQPAFAACFKAARKDGNRENHLLIFPAQEETDRAGKNSQAMGEEIGDDQPAAEEEEQGPGVPGETGQEAQVEPDHRQAAGQRSQEPEPVRKQKE